MFVRLLCFPFFSFAVSSFALLFSLCLLTSHLSALHHSLSFSPPWLCSPLLSLSLSFSPPISLFSRLFLSLCLSPSYLSALHLPLSLFLAPIHLSICRSLSLSSSSVSIHQSPYPSPSPSIPPLFFPPLSLPLPRTSYSSFPELPHLFLFPNAFSLSYKRYLFSASGLQRRDPLH